MTNSWVLYDQLLDEAINSVDENSVSIEKVCIGLIWTMVKLSSGSIGLAMSPNAYTRILPWSGELRSKSATEVSQWVKNWHPQEACIGMATINALLNRTSNKIINEAVSLNNAMELANLSVFEHFKSQYKDQKVAVIGRYPAMETLAMNCDLTIIERQPEEGDFPDPACEYILPKSDWVFLTASAIHNKTAPRLLELAKNAKTVLMGPGTPWTSQFTHYDVQYLAGVKVVDEQALLDTISEGGGRRIFNKAVQYHVLEL